MKTEHLLNVAAVLQFALLSAGAAMSKVTAMPVHLAGLPVFLRQLFWVYLGFIGFVIAGFGVVTVVFANELPSGIPLARGFCLFAGLFWLGRLALQWLVFDVRPYLVNRWLKLGHWVTTATFAFLAAVYAHVAWGTGLQ